MLRNLAVALIALAVVGPLAAHFVRIVPDDKEPAKARVIFSNDLKVDGRLNIDRISATRLFAFEADGSASPRPVAFDLEKNAATVAVGTAVLIGGTCEYGVVQRGETGGVRIAFHPKLLVGDPASIRPTLAGRVPVEILVSIEGGKVRFQAIADGRPLARTSLTLLMPGSNEPTRVTTDDRGFSPAYENRGPWGVHFVRSTRVVGEFQGKQYEELREYATLAMKW